MLAWPKLPMKINCYLVFYQFLKSKWSRKEDPDSTIATRQNIKNSRPQKEACSATDFRIHGRALHYSFKVGDRNRTIRFYREILGMKVLRHEEFTQGCEANTNGPYDNRWSKTMVGYGPEDDFFAFELTYNYPVHNYLKGNEFISVTIKSREVISRARTYRWPILDGNILEAPGGFRFHILDEPQPVKGDPVVKITLACSDYRQSLRYWHGVLGLILFERDNKKRSISVGFKSSEVKLELQQIEQPVQLGEQSGRISFSCPHYQQSEIARRVTDKGFDVVVPLVALETPGKAVVRVLILSDPDGHEVCFVEDLAFRHLSQYSPEDEEDLDRYIAMENERDDIIGEPAKRAEYKQIENSVRRANTMAHKGDAKKNVSITLPVVQMTSKESVTSRKSIISTIQPDDEETLQKIQTAKMTVVITQIRSKEKAAPKRSKKLKREKANTSITSQSGSFEEVPLGDQTSSEASQKLSEISFDLRSPAKVVSIGTGESRDSSLWNATPKSSIDDLRAKPGRSEEIEVAVRKVMLSKVQETISLAVSQHLEATVSKVVAERVNETVQKTVSEKIAETVAKAVAQIEDSVKRVVSNNLSIIQEETERLSLPGSLEDETDSEGAICCSAPFSRSSSGIAVAPLRESA